MASDLAARTPSVQATTVTNRLPLAMLGVGLAIVVPAAALVGWVHGAKVALLGPILGPWAGLSIGHRDCTMATQMPEVTWSLVATGIAIALCLLSGLARRRMMRVLVPALFAVWLLGWCGAALLSFVNASS